jgi:hypothetical protein
MIGFIGTSLTITLNYNHLKQITIGDCLRLVPFLPGTRASSTLTDLGLIHESATSSASVVLWITLHSWTLFTIADFCMTDYSSTDVCYNCLATDLHEWRLSYEWLCWWLQYDWTELPNELPSITWCGPETEHSPERFVCCIRLLHPLSRERVSIPQQTTCLA